MRRVVVLLGLGTLAALIGCRGNKPDADLEPAPPPVEWTADVQWAAEGNNAFALALYKQLSEQEKGKNVFYSPYSVHGALAMTATGAKGNTRDQMLKVLRLPTDAQVLAAGDMGRYYAHPRKDFELSVANALWGQKGFPWRAEWLAVQNERFGAGFNEADFGGNPEGERLRVNKWVEEKTRDRIKELLLRDQITQDTRMVLTNAIYFKGKWATQFKTENTRNEPFKCDDGTKVDVPMMNASLACRYGHDDGVTMIALPYQGGELAMIVVLPKNGEKLSELEKRLTPERFAKWFSRMGDCDKMPVAVPRFKIESRYELPERLKALGMVDAFDPDHANFTGMSDRPPLYISAVAHKAFVEVNEEGTEAAAATAVVVTEKVAATTSEPFRADRPFLFLIRDTKHGTILFVGRVEKP